MPNYNWRELSKEIYNKESLPFIKVLDGCINVSEFFYSIQGEGKTVGIPTIFLRLQGCNLLCKFPCDTIPVWRTGKSYSYEELLKEFLKRGFIDKLEKGTHLVITGGEPLLRQKEIIEFLSLVNMPEIFVEIETNGTRKPEEELDRFISLYNVSPKLENSKMQISRRYFPSVLSWFNRSEKAIFKFVVDKKKDIDEVINNFILPIKIDNRKIYIMPEAVSRRELLKKQEWIVELCKNYGFRFGNRLQIMIYDEVTGV